MKLKAILFMAACIVATPLTSTIQAQVMSTKDAINEKATKTAKKEAKTLKKEGWLVSPGALPLDKMLDNMYSKRYATDENGAAAYVIGEGRSIGSTYDAAKLQALTVARQNMAGQIESNVTQLIESSLSNGSINDDEATSLSKVLSESKTLIGQSLGRTQTPMECYRKLNNGNYEVMVQMVYSWKDALKMAKKNMTKNLADDQVALKDRINALED